MVIIGGIGSKNNASHALSDVYTLNLTTLQWSNIGPNVMKNPTLLLSSTGPMKGIYGHVTFAVRRTATNIASSAAKKSINQQGKHHSRGDGGEDEEKGEHNNNDNKHAEEREEDNENTPIHDLIVFGGSSNVVAHTSNCYVHMFRFDMLMQSWSSVDTGYLYPSARVNHSVAVVRGTSHQHLLPPASDGGMVGDGEHSTAKDGKGLLSRSYGIKFTNPMVSE